MNKKEIYHISFLLTVQSQQINEKEIHEMLITHDFNI